MKCTEAAEFVSALCDGEIIPSEAAAHIGDCELCQERLREYSAIGIEMRRVASLEATPQLEPPAWHGSGNRLARFWQKGWESMRIPKFAFALLVIAVVALASSLAVNKVGAHSEGSVVLLKIDAGFEEPITCPLSTVDKNSDVCIFYRTVKGRNLGYRIKLLDHEGNRVRIDVRSKDFGSAIGSHSFSYSDMDNVAGQEYWFQPGEPLKIDTGEVGQLTITGEWMDHMPALPSQNNQSIDPAVDELRMVSPLLLRDNKVVGDLNGFTGTLTKPEQAAWLYFPNLGDFTISVTPMKASVPADVQLNRLSFKEDGHSYVIVTGAPVARSSQVWVLHRPAFKPALPNPNAAFAGSVTLHRNEDAEWTTPIPLP